MKLLNVISSMNPCNGGPSEAIRSLSPHLSRLGNVVETVCFDDPSSDYLAKDIVKIHALGAGLSSWCYSPALQPWLAENLPRFDAVILNGLWQFPGFSLSRISVRPGMPSYFIFPHGMLDPWFQRAKSRRVKALRNWFYWRLIESKVIRGAEALFFTCSEEMRLAQETFSPYEPKRQISVGFGVSEPPIYEDSMTEAFERKCPEVSGRPYFLFLGRIHPKKGLDILIQAYAASYQTNSNIQRKPPCLVIAGPGLETDYGRNMMDLAKKACPDNQVFWPGMLTGNAKWGAVYNTEAFVLTSHQENFGIAVAEALACKTPVLISNKVNIWREIEQDRAGLVEDDTLAGARELFRRWESLSFGDRQTMKNSARFSHTNRFGIAQIAGRLMANINELANGSRS
jgi:glycosyltransferase involved in cell wall biosynthesis